MLTVLIDTNPTEGLAIGETWTGFPLVWSAHLRSPWYALIDTNPTEGLAIGET
jgi:hypothetical protein